MRNFVHGKPSKEIPRHGRSLFVVQLLHSLLNEASSFFQGQTGCERHIAREHFRLDFFDLQARVIPAAFEVTPLVDGSCVGVSEKQRPEGASLLVVPQHRGVHFEEKALYQVFGFGLVPYYRIRQAKYILPIPVKENEKGSVIAFGYFPAQSFIGERAKLVRSVKPFPEDHLALSRCRLDKHLNGIAVGKDTYPSMNNPPPVRDNIQPISMR
jgi:hypothetical protein